MSNEKEAYKAIREMLGKLEDPYTRFMNPVRVQKYEHRYFWRINWSRYYYR